MVFSESETWEHAMSTTPESVTRLIEDLKGDDEFEHSQAAFALGMLGEPAVQPLIDLLTHERAEVRMRAAWSLGVMGRPALHALTELAEGDDPKLRIEAIRILGVIGEARALKQLLVGLADPDERIAARAARAIGKIGDPRSYHALLTTLHHPNADVRFEACRALADLHIPESAPFLLELAERDTEHTSWGASVAELARRAATEVSKNTQSSFEEEFDRISKLLHEHQHRVVS
jgi:HEAT repeat protein